MQQKTVVLTLVSVLAAALLLVGSCKDRAPEDAPQAFDPAYDGVAVRPLPPPDEDLPRRLREGRPAKPAPAAEADAASPPARPARPSRPEPNSL